MTDQNTLILKAEDDDDREHLELLRDGYDDDDDEQVPHEDERYLARNSRFAWFTGQIDRELIREMERLAKEGKI